MCGRGVREVAAAYGQDKSERMKTAMSASGRNERKTIFVDLDDTLVDTFGLLITPLEIAAARAIAGALPGALGAAELATALLELRRRCPAELEPRLRLLVPGDPERALAVRRAIFADFAVDALTLDAEVAAALAALRQKHGLVLVSEGRSAIQERKIRHLGLATRFDDVLVLENTSEGAKEAAIRAYLEARGLAPDRAIVVGNRLDREIAAGRNLGAFTVWVRCGEGSEMTPAKEDERPHLVIGGITELPAALDRLPES